MRKCQIIYLILSLINYEPFFTPACYMFTYMFVQKLNYTNIIIVLINVFALYMLALYRMYYILALYRMHYIVCMYYILELYLMYYILALYRIHLPAVTIIYIR